ncbi:MAG: LuxR C-terminal-related transcriptional regulator [Acidobacteria bacterium]|nr:LuxR C-terminal-related transcriptional regulator [Acidobacteriota bacterium]
MRGQKVTIPDRVVGYVHRAELVYRAMPTRRRLTVLKASGGFGKTTLLAECCRGLRREGVPVAWVSLDARDEPAVLDTYIAMACERAGLDLLKVSDIAGTSGGPEHRIGVVAREIQASGKPFVIAFDELERLENPASVSLLEFLLQRGPSNLYLAMACRRIPDGLNVAGAALDGRAQLVTTEDLRFSRFHAAEFFDRSMSRDALTAEMKRSLGWPFALRISRNLLQRGGGRDAGVVQDLAENWIESRLFADLGGDDRDFILDIGLFDWMDAPLLDEVFERGDSLRRLQAMRVLVGLLEPSSAGTVDKWQLHPLVREHCAERRLHEDPRRFRNIHRRIAGALARRGDPVAAMRHAVEGGDAVLAGEILERAGGVRVWILQGLTQLQAADRYLSEDVVSTRPRLVLVRCLVWLMSGRVEEARRRYQESITPSSDRLVAGRELLVEDCVLRGAIALYGGELLSSAWIRTLQRDYTQLAESELLDPVARGFAAYGLCVLYQVRAAFDTALDWLERARHFLARSKYITMHGELLLGQVDMARGRVQDAESHYRKAQRMASKSFVVDPAAAAGVEIMLQELRLECSQLSSAAELRSVPIALAKRSMPFSGFAAACSLLSEQSLQAGRISQALTRTDQLLDYTRGAGMPACTRYVAAVRVSVLVIAGKPGAAERAWRLDNLPSDATGCLDLSGQSWREMEAISCARLRWLTASRRFAEGRELARKFRETAVQLQLRRTLMRATVLSMVLEQRAGEPESAMAHLKDFLGLFSETPYAWPLLQERAVCRAPMEAFLERHPKSPLRETARSLLAAMRRAEEVRGLVLSKREHAVLKLLEGRLDKQIGAELGLTPHGVRYHLRKLFARLGVTSRAEAVRRGRELGLIPHDS